MTDTLERLRATIGDRYRIEREIGRGGMATVYLAEDLKHGRRVAIKVLRSDLAAMLGAERFLQEIRLTANLQHPHIVALYDSGDADGILYYVMPYVEGESLRDRLNREGRLDAREASRIASEVAAALEYAHRRDIVHRDIKPENILLLKEGSAQVADFGVALATAAAAGAGSERLTAIGMAVGTPAYMSPEQASGESSADARSDIYSLGCVLYEMLAGDPPFKADTAQKVLSQQVTATPRSLAAFEGELPGALVAVVERMLEKDPAARYPTAREAATALDQATLTGATPTVGSGAWLVEQVLDPRMLAALGGYVVTAIAAVAAMKWVAGKYLLSAQLPWVVGVAMLSFLPAAAVLAWRLTGSPGGLWRRVARVALPVNVVGAIALLFVLFGSSDLGAATIAVSVRNEMGDLINRDIPKSAYRRRVALFPVENRSQDPELDWIQRAVPAAVSVDLDQDPFVRALESADFRERLEEAGRPDGLGLPIAQKRHIASGLYMQYFTGGDVTREGDDLVVTLELYDTQRANLVERRVYRGHDLLDMVDDMSAQLRRDMGIPAGALESAPDLPASELLTESATAFRLFIDGWIALSARRFDDAADRFGAAVTEDESFALANLLRYVALMQASRSEEAEPALAQAMEHSYRLNERTQLMAKLRYYFLVQQDAEKAMAVATMWTELYPEDPAGHVERAGLLQLRNDLVGVIDELQQVIALDSTQYNLLMTIGQVYSARGVFDTARTYLEAYAERKPGDPEGFRALAEVALIQADFDAAGDLYERALLLDAQDPLALKGLGDVATVRGDFAAAARHYDAALVAARTVGQRSAVFDAMADLFTLQGRINEALVYLRQYWAAQDTVGGPMQGNQMRLQSVRVFAMAGMVDAALDSVRAIEERLGEAFSSLGAMGLLPIAVEIDSVPLIVEGIERTEALIANFALEALRPVVLRARARVAELEGRCAEALPLYRQGRDLVPIATGFDLDIARCMAIEGDTAAAVQMLRDFVGKRPAVPRAYYELAAALQRAGRDAEARTELDRALAFWSEADPGFLPLRKAQALAAQLQ